MAYVRAAADGRIEDQGGSAERDLGGPNLEPLRDYAPFIQLLRPKG